MLSPLAAAIGMGGGFEIGTGGGFAIGIIGGFHRNTQMYPHYARNNVPTYIIGPELGDGPMEYRPANILQVWPQRRPMECLRPDEFNPHLDVLISQHCR